MLYMFAQSTLISYHTEDFVETEVGCTVTTLKKLSFLKDCFNTLVQGFSHDLVAKDAIKLRIENSPIELYLKKVLDMEMAEFI